MAITIPTDLELLAANSLLGHVWANTAEPLNTLLRRSNWDYAKGWRPSPATLAPVDNALRSLLVIEFPFHASADARDYSIFVHLYKSGSGDPLLTLHESVDGSTWTALSSVSMTGLSSGINYWSGSTSVILATTRFLRATISQGTSETFQAQFIAVPPRKLSSIAVGPLGSGFLAYDDAPLNPPADEAVHVEYINRVWANARAIAADLKQCVFSFVSPTIPSAPADTFARRSNQTHFYAGYGAASLPGQALTTLDIKVKVDYVTTAGKVLVGQVGGNQVELDADGTVNTDTLEVFGDLPTLYAILVPGATGHLRPRYIWADWTPSLGSSNILAAGPAPMARLEYLTTLERVTMEQAVGGYAQPCLCFNSNDAIGPTWHHGAWIPAGHDAARAVVGRSTNGDEDAASPDAELWSAASGAAPADKILVPAEAPGAHLWPPELNNHVALASNLVDATPSGTGTNRSYELATDREPYLETMEATNSVSHSIIARRVLDPATLP